MFFPTFYVDNDKFGTENKIQFTLHYQNWKNKNLLVVVITDVVTDPTKLGKSTINFERKVEEFEQRPIKVDEIVPFSLPVIV